MSSDVTVFGFGPVGRETTRRLLAQGVSVRVAQRHGPRDLPQGARFIACDVLDAEAVRRTTEGAQQIVVAVGFPYAGDVWRVAWPRAMTNFVSACAATHARMVFVDNLYMYGPQNAPLREDMPLVPFGVKPAVRVEATRIWMAAAEAGRIRATALRASDFYGPGVTLSHLGANAFGAIAKRKRAFLLAPPDAQHDFAYVPDVARGVVTLLDAPDDAYGHAWHLPCAPTRTPREILILGAQALDRAPRIFALPLAALPVLGLGLPLLREMTEMRFLWDRPYRVDAQKFSSRFWSDPTPLEVGATATVRSFVDGV